VPVFGAPVGRLRLSGAVGPRWLEYCGLAVTTAWGRMRSGFFVSRMMVGDKDSGKVRKPAGRPRALRQASATKSSVEKLAAVNPDAASRRSSRVPAVHDPRRRESQALFIQNGRGGIYTARPAKVMKGTQVDLPWPVAAPLAGVTVDLLHGHASWAASQSAPQSAICLPGNVVRHMIKKNQTELTTAWRIALDLDGGLAWKPA